MDETTQAARLLTEALDRFGAELDRLAPPGARNLEAAAEKASTELEEAVAQLRSAANMAAKT